MPMVPSLGETKQLFSTSTLKSHKGIKKKVKAMFLLLGTNYTDISEWSSL